MLNNLSQSTVVRKFLDWSASEPGKAIITGFIVILVGLSGFGLGRLSKTEESKAPLTIREAGIDETAAVALSQETAMVKGGQVVASKNGSKYHFPWCSGAKSISEANKIFFASAEGARKEGYAPASNCKGLK